MEQSTKISAEDVHLPSKVMGRTTLIVSQLNLNQAD